MKIIGLGHYSRTGKDTVANALVSELTHSNLRVKKISFAWKLKQIAHELYGWAGVKEPAHYETPEGEIDRTVKLTGMASEKYPEGPTVVDIWIDLGTPAIRENVYENTWIDYVLRTDHECDVLIIPDTRFFNEVVAIKELGGTLIKVVRPGFRPRNSPADMNLFKWRGWDGVIGTTGNMMELKYEASRIAKLLKRGEPLTFSELKTSKGYQLEAELAIPQAWVDEHSVQQQNREDDILHRINTNRY